MYKGFVESMKFMFDKVMGAAGTRFPSEKETKEFCEDCKQVKEYDGKWDGCKLQIEPKWENGAWVCLKRDVGQSCETCKHERYEEEKQDGFVLNRDFSCVNSAATVDPCQGWEGR